MANRYAKATVRVRASRNARRARAAATQRPAGAERARPAPPLAAAIAAGAVVVVQEDLLERGLAAREGGDRVLRERRDQRADAAA